ncbi:MAG TPA: 3-hydroxyacyl-CoA dehydrogenase NAD-binding domain-containing protein, partial [Roseococcus sp.]|nr:3-hydroxyacyl-CoA dehydrogenase NAD-binding domain-containing protein [Roseococcus sp.]
MRIRVANLPDGLLAVPEIRSIGIVGAGQMGSGIAHVASLAGLPVAMVDIS